MEAIEYTSKVFYGKEILFRKYGGKLTAVKEIQMLQYAVDNDLITDKVVGMVLDMREAQFRMEPGDGLKIIDYTINNPILAPLKYAIIVETPEQIMFPLLGSMKREGHKLLPFSTEEAAVMWVLT